MKDKFIKAYTENITRPGADKLLAWIESSDFFTAPASTRFHLSSPGGLLEHSLHVFERMKAICANEATITPGFNEPSMETIAVCGLLHDICKTFFYTTSTRNAKNEKTGKWEKVPYYTVDDKMPLGHGAKSAMIIKQYMELTTEEMYAIWWHMGFTGSTGTDTATISQAIDKHPLIWALHTADMMASHFMEGEKGNLDAFADPAPESAGEYADAPAAAEDGEPVFHDAPPLASEGA